MKSAPGVTRLRFGTELAAPFQGELLPARPRGAKVGRDKGMWPESDGDARGPAQRLYLYSLAPLISAPDGLGFSAAASEPPLFSRGIFSPALLAFTALRPLLFFFAPIHK